MSDLRPKGIPVTIGGEERNFLFTLNAIDDIQDHFEMSLAEIISNLVDKELSYKTMRYIIMALLNDEAEREAAAGEDRYKRVTEKEVGWLVTLENEATIVLALLEAYGYSLPKGEDEDPNQMSRPAME